jgi:hypothetical protein
MFLRDVCNPDQAKRPQPSAAGCGSEILKTRKTNVGSVGGEASGAKRK